MRLLGIIFYGIAGFIILLAGFIGGWMYFMFPQTDGHLTVNGLGADVEIYRDDSHVPHIFAQTEKDAYTALGFVHAQDRFWQMEIMRRLGQGRLSEIIGETTVSTDKFMRTLGIGKLASDSYDGLSEETRLALSAYANGVNAWLDGRNFSLPLEFQILRYVPDPWKSVDSLIWGKLMAFQLSGNWRGELLRLELSKTLTPQQIQNLWPNGVTPVPVSIPDAPKGAILKILDAIPIQMRFSDASNAWVINGGKTKSGKPILANDPHLGFSAPIPWYLAHIETESGKRIGATMPGVPFHILGQTGHAAWGMTSTGADSTDIVINPVDPANDQHFIGAGGPEQFSYHRETIRVKGLPPIEHIIRRTRHGIVLSDVLSAAPSDAVLSLKSIYFEKRDSSPDALRLIAAAQSGKEIRAAISMFQAPVINFTYATPDNETGLLMAGRIPMRNGYDGWTPADGQKRNDAWVGYLQPHRHPNKTAGEDGIVFNANNRLVGDGYPYLITRKWDAPYRALRIGEVLPNIQIHGVADSMRLQSDNISVVARRLLPLMTAIEVKATREKQAIEHLKTWRFDMDKDKPQPLIFTTWLKQFVQAAAADELGENFSHYWRSRPEFVEHVLTRSPLWCDNTKTPITETCEAALRNSFKATIAFLTDRFGPDVSRWRWGEAHIATFENQFLGRVPVLRSFSNLTLQTDGGDHTVNRGQTGHGLSHAHNFGAGYKAVYDLSDAANSRFMIATGQSGNPFSRHYRDLLKKWGNGLYIPLMLTKTQLKRTNADLLILQPSKPE